MYFKYLGLWALIIGGVLTYVYAAPGTGSLFAERPDSAIPGVLDLSDQASDRAQEALENSTNHKPVCPGRADDDAGRCNAEISTTDSGDPSVSLNGPSGFGPKQLHAAYADQVNAPKPTIIAIIDPYDHPRIYQDLTTYSKHYGIPVLPQCAGAIANSAVPCFKKVNQNGGTTYPAQNAYYSLEIALDVEAAHAMCQNCSILLVEVNNTLWANFLPGVDRAVAMGAKIVSMSFSGDETADKPQLDYHFNHPGIAFVASSGDGGHAAGTQWPASSPFVTGVGGTTLRLNTLGDYGSESAWARAGSGCSKYEAKRAWQTDGGCTHKSVADVSAVSNPNTGAAIYDSVPYAGYVGWFKAGGTSLAAPIIAGIYALSGNTSGNASAIPYAHRGQLHDITTGANGACTSYFCQARVGYDGPTGLGTPNGVGAF